MGDSAYGLTVSVGEFTGNGFSTVVTETDGELNLPTTPEGWSYNSTDRTWTYSYGSSGVSTISQYFVLDYSQITTGDQHVIYGTANSLSWGINTNEAGNALTGYWSSNNNNGRYTDKDGNQASTVDTLAGLQAIDSDSDKSITLLFSANNGGASGGTYLYDVTGAKVYDGGGLSTNSNGTLKTLTVNSDYVTHVVYENAHRATVSAGSWTQTYEKAVFNEIVSHSVDATIIESRVLEIGGGSSNVNQNNLVNGGDIIVGGSGQLFLQTYPVGAISINNDIYLGASTQEQGSLSMAAFSGDIDLAGNIILVEDAKITKERDKGNNKQVTIHGDVTGNYSLTLESLSTNDNDGKFEDVTFAGNVNIEGIVLAESNGSDITFSNATDDKIVQIGTITVNDGAHKVTFDEATTIGTLDLENGSDFTLAGTGMVTIKGGSLFSTISNTNANLAISGNWTADNLMYFDNESTYSDGDNGYFESGTFTIVDSAEGGTVSTTDTILTVNGVAHAVTTQDSDAVVIVTAGDSSNYYVNTTVDYTSGSNVANASSIVLNGGTLNLNTALTSDAKISAVPIANPGKVVVGNGVTLNNLAIDGTNGDVVLAGGATAVYDLAAATTANASFGTEWYGTTKLTGTTLTGSVDLASFANGKNSTIEFSATSGWITAKTNTFNVLLAEGNAITFNNGGNNEHHVFTGKISGTGNIVRQNNTGSFQYYDVQGDVSGWTGTFEHKNTNSAHESTITLSGVATTVKANFLQSGGEGGKLSVVVNNTNDVTMSGSVSATAGTIKLQNSGTGKVQVAEVRAIGGNVQLSGTGSNEIEIGTLSIAEGNTVGNGVTTTRNNNANSSTNDAGVNVIITTKLDVGRTDGLNVSGALTLKDNVTVDVTDLTLTDGTYSYNLATAANGVTVGTYSVTGLSDSYSSYAARVSAVDPNAAAGVAAVAEGNSNTNLVLTLELVKLTVTSATGYENGVLTLTTAEKATGVIFGESLDASVSDDIWAQITKGYTLDEEYSITFVGADGTTFDFDGDGTLTAPTITFMGETATALTGGGTIVGTFTIPEPTTATLSLLALAALAARRRRR